MQFRLTPHAAKWLLVTTGLAMVTHLSHAAEPTKILFIGNSFTHANFLPALRYNAANVHDLNNTGYGGVPGIFKKLTDEAGLNYDVSIEAVGGQSLQYHYKNKLAVIGSRKFDVVVMQDYSTLDNAAPGNPANVNTYSKLLEQYIHGPGSNKNANAATKVYLTQTWARADQVYNTPGGFWNGSSVEKMTGDLHAAYYDAAARDAKIVGVNPAGDAFLRVITGGLADRNPYDGIDAGKFTLWGSDQYHPSAWGSYLVALTVFGKVTGRDPRTIGADQAASGLGISATQATALQRIAYDALQFDAPNAEALVSGPSGRCLDASKTTDGAKLVIYDCAGNSNQKWTPRPNGTIEAHGKCLDLMGPTTGSVVGLWGCSGGTNQQWRFNNDGSISNVKTGFCLDVNGGRVDNDTPVNVWRCTGAAHQKWTDR